MYILSQYIYILYNEFIKEELKRLLGRSKSRADAAPNNDSLFHKIRYRNWLSAINASSGAWLTAGEFGGSIFGRCFDECTPKYGYG